jgi:hypothetical protein
MLQAMQLWQIKLEMCVGNHKDHAVALWGAPRRRLIDMTSWLPAPGSRRIATHPMLGCGKHKIMFAHPVLPSCFCCLCGYLISLLYLFLRDHCKAGSFYLLFLIAFFKAR